MTTAAIAGMVGPTGGQTNLLTSSEFKETRTIKEDLQGGTITHTFDLPGRPDEAYNNQLMGGLHVGDAHPFYRYSYLIHREFKTLVNRSRSADCRTRLTLIYKKRPCTNFPEMASSTALVSVNTWWTYEDPPQIITPAPEGFPILLSQTVLNLRWPYIELRLDEIRALRRWNGHLLQPWETPDPQPDRTFYGESRRDMLLEGVQHKLLYGDVNWDTGATAAWELSLHIRIDRWRHHQWWKAEYDHVTHDDPSGDPPVTLSTLKPVTSLDELRAGVGHKKYKIKPAIPDQAAWEEAFAKLGGDLPAADGYALCGPPEIGTTITPIGKVL